MLLPTSPLRKTSTLDNAIEKFLECRSNYKSLVSVCSIGKSEFHLRKFSGNTLIPFKKSTNYNIQRQNQSNLYLLNGSIYISMAKTLIDAKTFHFDELTTYFEMDKLESIDVDSIDDILLAEYFLKKES